MPSSSRREFLLFGAVGAAAGLAAACTAVAREPSPPTAPAPIAPIAQTAEPIGPEVSVPNPVAPTPSAPAAPPADQRTLVVIQLSGGHDGLNALVPYADGLYYQLRPHVSIPADQVLHLDDQVGLHPNLKSFKELYDQGHLAIVQGVGYPNPNRSHFRSMEIWQTARPDGLAPAQGWLGAFMAEVYKVGDSPFQCVNFGTAVPQALHTPQAPVAAMQDLGNFQFLVDKRLPTMKDPLLKTFGQVAAHPAEKTPALDLVAGTWAATQQGVDILAGVTEKYQPKAQYPNNPFGKTLQQVAQMLSSDVGTRVFYLQLGGFDTHANEKPAHATLMSQLADSLAAFQSDLEGHASADRVLTMMFSEFGRRVKENGSQGTDHGAAGPMFVLGKAVKGGLFGEHPNLTNLDDGDLRYTVDFRSTYATVIEDWLGGSGPEVLGGTFPKLGFVAA